MGSWAELFGPLGSDFCQIFWKLWRKLGYHSCPFDSSSIMLVGTRAWWPLPARERAPLSERERGKARERERETALAAPAEDVLSPTALEFFGREALGQLGQDESAPGCRWSHQNSVWEGVAALRQRPAL